MVDEPADWTAWGEQRPALSRHARAFLDEELGPLPHVPPAARLADTAAPPSMLTDSTRAALTGVVGDQHVHEDGPSRLRHATGLSYIDLIRRRAGTVDPPDAVVTPADGGEVSRLLAVCTSEQIAVVPFGGGTSVVGGVEPVRGGFRAVIALDLRRLDQLIAVDELSLTATLQAGMRAPDAEAALNEHGLTLGHFPQSYQRASIGGFVVTRSAGQASTGYGRIDELLVGVRLATPTGVLALPTQPASAAGPDLRRLVLGSEGIFGVVTEATLRVHRLPESRRYEAWMTRSWEDGLAVTRQLVQDGPPPDVCRLSDPAETRVGLELTGPQGTVRQAVDAWLRAKRIRSGCLVILGFEGDRSDIRHRRRRAARLLRSTGAAPLGRRGGESWRRGRFSGPELRDTLLDSGVLVETLETAAAWSALPAVHERVRAALTETLGRHGRSPLVGCHVSHLYPTGASLYFTVLAAVAPDPIRQWEEAKRAASDAIAATGATITHHHAVGTAHRPWLAGEDGELGIAMLAAVKRALDPAGILNPGKLLP